MKDFTLTRIVILAGIVTLTHSIGGVEGKTNEGEEEAAAQMEYVGKLPKKKLDTLAEHRVIARYEGAPFRRCMGLTGKCPDRCGNSGEFATFTITGYLHYAKKGEYGDAKQKQFRIQISDFHRRPAGNAELNKVVAGLKENDLVQLEWKHLYGRVSPGVQAPARPVLLLRKVSAAEAAKLKEDADKDKPTKPEEQRDKPGNRPRN